MRSCHRYVLKTNQHLTCSHTKHTQVQHEYASLKCKYYYYAAMQQ